MIDMTWLTCSMTLFQLGYLASLVFGRVGLPSLLPKNQPLVIDLDRLLHIGHKNVVPMVDLAWTYKQQAHVNKLIRWVTSPSSHMDPVFGWEPKLENPKKKKSMGLVWWLDGNGDFQPKFLCKDLELSNFSIAIYKFGWPSASRKFFLLKGSK